MKYKFDNYYQKLNSNFSNKKNNYSFFISSIIFTICWVFSAFIASLAFYLFSIIKSLEDIWISDGIKLTDAGIFRPITVVNPAPSDLHFVFAVPSLELVILEDQPLCPICAELMSLLETSIFNVVLAVFKELNVVDLRTVWIRDSCSDEIDSVFSVSSFKFECFFVNFVVFGEEIFDKLSIENNFKSVTFLVPKAISCCALKFQYKIITWVIVLIIPLLTFSILFITVLFLIRFLLTLIFILRLFLFTTISIFMPYFIIFLMDISHGDTGD